MQKAVTRRFNWRLAVVLVLGLVILAGTMYGLRKWRRGRLATQSLEIGNKAYDAKEWAKAAKELGRYISVHPKGIEAIPALLRYAEAQLRIQPQKPENVRQAVNAYRQILREHPEHSEAADKVSQLYIAVGTPADAISILERRLAASDDANARQLLGMALALTGNYKGGVAQFQKAIEIAPDNITAYQRLAELMRARPEEAPGSPMEILRTAVARNPNSAGAHTVLGGYLVRYGGGEESRSEGRGELEKAKQLDLSEPSARVTLAVRLIEIGDFAGAEEQLAAAAAADGSLVGLWLTWASLVRAQNARQQAGEVATRALEGMGPAAYVFLPTAVDLYVFAGDVGQAEKVLGQIKQIDPLQQDIAYLEGLIREAKGDLRGAVKFWREAAPSERESARSSLALAGAYQKIGDLPAAIRELRALASQHENASAVRLELAKVLGRTAAWQEASAHSAAAVRLDPSSLEARFVDINIRAHLVPAANSDSAAWRAINSEVEQMKSRFPDDRIVAVLVAEIAQMQGNAQAARNLAVELQATEATRVQGLLLEVENLWNDGKGREAVNLAREAVRQYPSNVTAIAQLSEMLLRSGDAAGSVSVLEDGQKNTQGDARRQLEHALASVFIRSGARDKAATLLEKVAAEDPGDIGARVLLIGMTDVHEGTKIQRLVDEIRRAEGEQGFRWRYQQARFWLMSEDWRKYLGEAEELLRANVKADPRDAESLLLLGVAQDKAGRLTLAIESFRRAYELAPQSAPVVFNLASALQKNKNLEEAGQILDDAAKRGISEPRLTGLKLGQQLRLGQTALAIETAEEILTLNPENAALQVFLASLKMRQNDLAGARTILEALDPADTNVLMGMVDLLMREGKRDEALSLCDKFVESSGKAGAYLLRARARASVGMADGAEADYRKITEIEGDKAASWMLLSDFLVTAGKFEDATKSVSRAVSIDPNDPAVVARAVRLYSRSADPDTRKSAETILDDALKANPEAAELVIFQAQRLMVRGTSESLTKAQQVLGELVRRRPEMVGAWVLYAQATLALGQADSALEAVNKALAAEPNDQERRNLLLLKADAEKVRWPAFAAATLRGLWEKDRGDIAVGLALASAYRQTGDPLKAVGVIDEMMSAANEGQKLILDLAAANALEAAGEHDKALQRVNKAAATAGGDPQVMMAIVRLYAKAGRVDEIFATVREWQTAHPQDVAGIVLSAEAVMSVAGELAGGDSSEQQRKLRLQDAAIVILQSAVSTYRDDYRVKLALATAYQARGDAVRAEELYRLILEKASDNPVALNNLAWLLAERGELKEALSLADRGRKRFPEFPEMVDTRGVIYHKMGRLGEAEVELNETVRLSPVNSRAMASAKLHLAEVLAAGGKKNEAVGHLNEVLGKASLAEKLSGEDRSRARQLLTELTAPAGEAQAPVAQ